MWNKSSINLLSFLHRICVFVCVCCKSSTWNPKPSFVRTALENHPRPGMGLRCCGWVAQAGSHVGVWIFSQHLVIPKVCEQSVICAAPCAWAFIIWDSDGCRGPKLCQWEHQLPNRNEGLCLCCALAQLYFLGISLTEENLWFWADNMIAASELKLFAKKCKPMEECKPAWVLNYSSPICLAFFPRGN